jgi:hypothetical protein
MKISTIITKTREIINNNMDTTNSRIMVLLSITKTRARGTNKLILCIYLIMLLQIIAKLL